MGPGLHQSHYFVAPAERQSFGLYCEDSMDAAVPRQAVHHTYAWPSWRIDPRALQETPVPCPLRTACLVWWQREVALQGGQMSEENRTR